MKKILLFIFIIISGISKAQEYDEIYIREKLNIKDSSVTVVYEDTLVNTEFVRKYTSLKTSKSGDNINIENDTVNIKLTGGDNEVLINLNDTIISTPNLIYNDSGLFCDTAIYITSGSTKIQFKNHTGRLFVDLYNFSSWDNVLLNIENDQNLDGNIFAGAYSGNLTHSGALLNSFYGAYSGYKLTNGDYNTGIGVSALAFLTQGSNNTSIGVGSGWSITTGSGNIFLGYQAGYNETGSNKLYIDNSNTGNPLLYGEFNNNWLKINDSLGIEKSIKFSKTNRENYSEGKLFYDTTLYALTFYNEFPDFTHQLGYEHVARYYNNTGTTIENGTLLTPIGQKINGIIIPTVRRAGIGSIDSLKMVGMSTTTTLNGEFGIATILGTVNNLNTSAFNDNDFVYVDTNGSVRNTSPEPPDYSLLVGKVIYADNDSGQIYMVQGNIDFTPLPHIGADTSRMNTTISITTQNVFEYLPADSAIIRDNHAFTAQGDSIQVQVQGYYTIILSMSFQGNPASETWRYGIFINNVEEITKSRTTSSNANGDVNVPVIRYLNKNDWISFRITNESGTGDPVVIDIGYEIIYLHE